MATMASPLTHGLTPATSTPLSAQNKVSPILNKNLESELGEGKGQNQLKQSQGNNSLLLLKISETQSIKTHTKN